MSRMEFWAHPGPPEGALTLSQAQLAIATDGTTADHTLGLKEIHSGRPAGRPA
jgi:hypothetical protein